jgi:hypothetical protein
MLALWALTALLTASPSAPPRTPVPAWVTSVTAPDTLQLPDGGTAPDAECLLRDVQVRVTDQAQVTVFHDVWRARTSEGVEEVASRSLEWDPASEVLAIHGVWVHRAGATLDAWVPADARIFAAEGSREERLYDGRLNLAVELRDVRVGDVVELRWSLTGHNDVFGAHYADTLPQFSPGPVGLLHQRVVWERSRPLKLRAVGDARAPTITTHGAVTEYVWRREQLSPHDAPPASAPPDGEFLPRVELSDWRDWAEVQQWADGLFSGALSPSPLLDAELARLKTLGTDEARLDEATRFVQHDVRYLGLELGQHSHRPHSPQWVLERRFGDCKDKALLLTALLRGVGLEAWPVLVNTARRHTLDELPSPFAFNHAIALVRMAAGEQWVDGTDTMGRGPVLSRPLPQLGPALVVRQHEAALRVLPTPELAAPNVEVEQHWAWPTRPSPATLTVTTTYTGAEADAVRALMTAARREAVFKWWLEQRKELDASLEVTTPGEYTDDEAHDVIRTVEHYQVKSFLDSDEAHQFEPLTLRRMLSPLPTEAPESFGAALPHPFHVRERILFDGPEPIDQFDAPPETVENEFLSAHLDVKREGPRVELAWAMHILRDRVGKAEWPTLERSLKAYRSWSRYQVKFPREAGRAHRRRSSGDEAPEDPLSLWWLVLGAGGVLGFLWVLSKVEQQTEGFSARQWWRKRRFQARFAASHGEEPATAVPVRSPEEAQALVGERCPAGHALKGAARLERPLSLGGASITPVSRTCETCGAVARRYVRLP